MKTNTLKFVLATVLAHLMCMTVVLSHLHAKDAVSLMSANSSVSKISSGDITAKALGDLHHHIDKAGVKNIHSDSTTAARVRDLKRLEDDVDDESLLAQFADFLLRLRVVSSLCYQYAL